jgi:hypothetical protein
MQDLGNQLFGEYLGLRCRIAFLAGPTLSVEREGKGGGGGCSVLPKHVYLKDPL